MVKLCITYNLNNDDDDYAELFEAIEALGDTWHDGDVLDSVWFLKTSLEVDVVAERLENVTDSDDFFTVIDVTESPSQGLMPEEFWEWLK